MNLLAFNFKKSALRYMVNLIKKYFGLNVDYKFCIDSLSNNKIEGWAFCKSDEIELITIKKGKEEVVSAVIEILREDVSNLFKCSPKIGFIINLPYKKYEIEGEITIWAKTKKQNYLQITKFGNKNKYLIGINKIISKNHKVLFKRYLDSSIEISQEYLEI